MPLGLNATLEHTHREYCGRQTILRTPANETFSFGTVATLLEMIPFASMFFAFTNTGMYQIGLSKPEGELIFCAVGAALWAADIEAKESQSK